MNITMGIVVENITTEHVGIDLKIEDIELCDDGAIIISCGTKLFMELSKSEVNKILETLDKKEE